MSHSPTRAEYRFSSEGISVISTGLLHFSQLPTSWHKSKYRYCQLFLSHSSACGLEKPKSEWEERRPQILWLNQWRKRQEQHCILQMLAAPSSPNWAIYNNYRFTPLSSNKTKPDNFSPHDSRLHNEIWAFCLHLMGSSRICAFVLLTVPENHSTRNCAKLFYGKLLREIGHFFPEVW